MQLDLFDDSLDVYIFFAKAMREKATNAAHQSSAPPLINQLVGAETRWNTPRLGGRKKEKKKQWIYYLNTKWKKHLNVVSWVEAGENKGAPPKVNFEKNCSKW